MREQTPLTHKLCAFSAWIRDLSWGLDFNSNIFLRNYFFLRNTQKLAAISCNACRKCAKPYHVTGINIVLLVTNLLNGEQWGKNIKDNCHFSEIETSHIHHIKMYINESTKSHHAQKKATDKTLTDTKAYSRHMNKTNISYRVRTRQLSNLKGTGHYWL